MARFFSKKITEDELAAKIQAAVENCRTSQESYPHCLKELTSTVAKDLNKVYFDLENVEPRYKTLPNGLACCWCEAGGDWECPLVFIIYFDGKQLRGYIPTDGNPWNTDLHMA